MTGTSGTSRRGLARLVGLGGVLAYFLATALVGLGLWFWLDERGQTPLLGALAVALLFGIPGLYRGLTRLVDPSMPVDFSNTTTERVQINGQWSMVTRTTGRGTGQISRRGAVILVGLSCSIWVAGVVFPVAVPLVSDLTRDPVEDCRRAHEEFDYIDFASCEAACHDNLDGLGCRLVSRSYAESIGVGNSAGRDFDQSLAYAVRACSLDDAYCRSVPYHECLADPEVCRGRCAQGDAENCFWLSKQYRFTYHRVQYDPSTADRYALRSCLLGRESSCKHSFDSACRLGIAGCDKMCREGNAVSCGWLSVVFRDGRGDTLADPEKQSKYAHMACDLDLDILPDCSG